MKYIALLVCLLGANAWGAEVNALRIITLAGSTGSFDTPSGTGYVTATRLFDLNGNAIPKASWPAWFKEAKAYLTSSSTGGGVGDAITPCAYFDKNSDNNPSTSGHYTVDGYLSKTSSADIDQCAGASADQLSRVGIYFTVDRAKMGTNDKLNVIVTAKPLDEPTTAPTVSSCVTAGYFDAASCVKQLFTVSMRTGPAIPTNPFYILFPSAKSLDLLSESIYLPINTNPNYNTISIDRVKGGAVFYSITVIRML